MSKPETTTIPVKFGNLSVGDKTANLGVVIDGHLDDEQARYFLCGSRLMVTLKVDPQSQDDIKGQETMGFTETQTVNATVDSHSVRLFPSRYSAALVFSLAEIDVGNLAHFAKHSGTMVAKKVGDAGQTQEGDADAQSPE
jgi:hypothetical protein